MGRSTGSLSKDSICHKRQELGWGERQGQEKASLLQGHKTGREGMIILNESGRKIWIEGKVGVNKGRAGR